MSSRKVFPDQLTVSVCGTAATSQARFSCMVAPAVAALPFIPPGMHAPMEKAGTGVVSSMKRGRGALASAIWTLVNGPMAPETRTVAAAGTGVASPALLTGIWESPKPLAALGEKFPAPVAGALIIRATSCPLLITAGAKSFTNLGTPVNRASRRVP